MTPTSEQTAAITQPGNVLLMAGAGTGKTRTLVERCLAWLSDAAQPGSLDEMLMVTFTEAAAAEMRQRIREALLERLQAHSGDHRCAEQLALLDHAHISTLHAFCLHVVRQHFHELGLDPQLGVLEDNQAHLLRAEVLEEILRRHYENADDTSSAVQRMIHERARGWDRPIRELVRRIHAHAQSLPNPQDWFQQQRARLEAVEPEFWRQCLRDGFAEWTGHWRPYIEAIPEDNPHARSFAGLLPTDLATLPYSKIAVILAEIISHNTTDRWPPRKATKLRKPLEKFLKETETWLGFLTSDDGIDPIAQDWQWVRPQMLCLLELAREFGQAYAQAKRAQAVVDFNDLEQFALQLLRDSGGAPSPVAELWRAKFHRVFVDEYQDINAAQDALLTALARPDCDGNRFLVGDVKQSIYRFRQANPQIFQRYAANWAMAGAPGKTLPLSENFRSHEHLLAFVDALFSQLMRREVGGVDYAPLRYGAPETRAHFLAASDPDGHRRVELHLLLATKETSGAADSANDDEEATPTAKSTVADRTRVEQEARFVAQRLRALHEQPLPVWDGSCSGFRPVHWSDMVVLLRGCRNRAASYAKEFARAGVPLLAARGGFFDELEVLDLLNLLRLLDNPLQDLPLLAVLRSPLVGLSLDELAAIRASRRHCRLWTALRAWDAQAGPEAAGGKVRQFLARQPRWRELARRHSLSSCLEDILRQTHYAEWCQAQERGAQRHANIVRLLDLARQYDPLQRQGLHRFLKFIAAHEEEELETEPAPAATRDAVRLMTIHQSKGLEFPVVVLAGLGANFNLRDSHDDVTLDENYGLCPKVQPPGVMARYRSVVHWLAGRRATRETLGEELRLLYVATTRARDHLVLCGVAAENEAGKWTETAELQPEAHRIQQARNYFGWIGPWLCSTTPDWVVQAHGHTPHLNWEVHDLNSVDRVEPMRPDIVAEAGGHSAPWPEGGELAALGQRLGWQYPFQPATRESAKSTATLLRRRFAEQNEEATALGAWTAKSGFSPARPTERLDAADIGSAHHQFLERFSLTAAGSEAALRAESARLAEAGELTPAQVASLNYSALARFWQSACGLKIRTQAAAVQRELPFTARLGVAELKALGLLPADHLLADEFIVVQGIADLAVILEREIWVLDYKSDEVRNADAVQAKTSLYSPQLRLYALALGRICRRKVTHLWLHFLKAGKTIEIAPPE